MAATKHATVAVLPAHGSIATRRSLRPTPGPPLHRLPLELGRLWSGAGREGFANAFGQALAMLERRYLEPARRSPLQPVTRPLAAPLVATAAQVGVRSLAGWDGGWHGGSQTCVCRGGPGARLAPPRPGFSTATPAASAALRCIHHPSPSVRTSAGSPARIPVNKVPPPTTHACACPPPTPQVCAARVQCLFQLCLLGGYVAATQALGTWTLPPQEAQQLTASLLPKVCG